MRQPNPDTRHPNDPGRDPDFDEWWEKEQDRIEEERIEAVLEMKTHDDFLTLWEAVWIATDDITSDLKTDDELNRRIIAALLTVPEIVAAVHAKVLSRRKL